MHPSVNICIIVKVDITDGINNALRFLGSGSVVEIDQLPVINLFIQQGKISPYFGNLFQAIQFNHISPCNWHIVIIRP